MDADPYPTENDASFVFFCNLWASEQRILAVCWTESLEAAKQATISCKLAPDLSGTVP